MQELKNGVKVFHAKTQADWRQWLAENHENELSVWLIIYKKNASANGFVHSDAVDEALCYGWIDSLTIKRDEESRYQFFSRRKPKSNWSAINKNKALKLIEQGLMQEAGLQCIKIARTNGMWDALNDVENIIVPEDLKKEFETNTIGLAHWEKFPRSTKKAILKWISEAKREETRINRIVETVKAAAANKRIK